MMNPVELAQIALTASGEDFNTLTGETRIVQRGQELEEILGRGLVIKSLRPSFLSRYILVEWTRARQLETTMADVIPGLRAPLFFHSEVGLGAVAVYKGTARSLYDEITDFLRYCMPHSRLVYVVAEAARILSQVLQEFGVGHACLTPQNILVDGDRVVVSDLLGAVSRATICAVTGSAIPSSKYQAPEEEHHAHDTPEANVFNLGAILNAVLSHRQLFPGMREHEFRPFVKAGGRATMFSEIHPASLNDLTGEQVSALEDIIRRCTAQDPADRPTMEQLHQELCAVQTM